MIIDRGAKGDTDEDEHDDEEEDSHDEDSHDEDSHDEESVDDDDASQFCSNIKSFYQADSIVCDERMVTKWTKYVAFTSISR